MVAKNSTYPIDFVLTWVDGNDSNWRNQRDAYLSDESNRAWTSWATGEQRYRDWRLLRYWFRAVESFAPWVNKIHFVTWGHVPAWLNLDHRKLDIVYHEDYIPGEYLPTFNSDTLDLNLHRIPGITDRFVLFNDDLFLLKPVKPQDFFIGNKTRDMAGLDSVIPQPHALSARFSNAQIINAYFNKSDVIRKNLFKWINPLYGQKSLMKTLINIPYGKFTGIQSSHYAINLKKETFEELWDLEHDELDAVCRHKFRTQGPNIWLMKDWNRAKGDFVPQAQPREAIIGLPGFYDNNKNIDKLNTIIDGGKFFQTIVFDEISNTDTFDYWREAVASAFEQLLPAQSSFEKYPLGSIPSGEESIMTKQGMQI